MSNDENYWFIRFKSKEFNFLEENLTIFKLILLMAEVAILSMIFWIKNSSDIFKLFIDKLIKYTQEYLFYFLK